MSYTVEINRIMNERAQRVLDNEIDLIAQILNWKLTIKFPKLHSALIYRRRDPGPWAVSDMWGQRSWRQADNPPYYTPANTLTAEQRSRMRGCHLTVVDGVDCYDTSDVLTPPI